MMRTAMGPDARQREGLSDSLLRLSVGIESGEDLCADLRHALDGIVT
jgi:cystathionine beta-lyase/cystathionine gamma-synthase